MSTSASTAARPDTFSVHNGIGARTATSTITPNDQDAAQAPPLTAIKKRALQPLLVTMFAVQSLLHQLPLAFPVGDNLPLSPKTRYRSQYRYLGPQRLLDRAELTKLSDFEIALYLIDFSPLERRLAQVYYVPSDKGQAPFHPVSMFLCICLRREQKLSWTKLARLLKGDNGAGWRALLGFQGDTPSASGLRYFFNTVGPEVFDELCPRFIQLLRQHALLPEESTYPGDPAGRGVTVSHDGMLHPALSRPSCQLATDDCYQPLPAPPGVADNAASQPHPDDVPIGDAADSPQALEQRGSGGQADQPEVRPGRPCRAKEKGLPGCNCDTPACQAQCRRASVLDPKARFIHYEGNNGKHKDGNGETKEESKGKGVDVFGYRSAAQRILDDRFAVAWTGISSLYPANTDERDIFPQEVQKLLGGLPNLRVGEYLGDAGVGFAGCLNVIWDLGAFRMVDIRADESDKDPAKCIARGYDENGHPLCPHGYKLHSNGYDYQGRQRKWVCAEACCKEPLREGEAISPVEGCAFLNPDRYDGKRRLGYTMDVGRAFRDGSVRLAREICVDSEEWDRRYGRRNNSESRNSQMESLGLKRMKSYGSERDTKEVQVADFLIDLRTLVRLVREATSLWGK